MSYRWSILAACSVSCMVDGEPREASGVQFGDEGGLLCEESTVEPWDPELVPEPFVEAPSVTRDRVVGAWLGDAALVDGRQIDLAVDIAVADGPVELVRMTPDDDPRCEGTVRMPVTIAVDGGDTLATTLHGHLVVGTTFWYFDTAVDGSEVDGTLAPSDGTPLEDVELNFYALSEAMDGATPVQGGIDFVFFETEASDTVVPGAREGWASVDLTR